MKFLQKKIKEEKAKEKKEQKQLQLELDSRDVVGYARVSTDRQEQDGYGLDYQINKIEEYCKSKELYLSKVFSEAFTGRVNEREEFEQLEQAIKEKKIKTLITYKLDRLGRSQINVLNFVNRLKEHNVQLITLEPEIDYNTQAGQILLSNLTMFAEIESNMISERTESGRMQKFQNGIKCQGSILGYEHNNKTKQYEVVKEEEKLVLYIFRTYLKSKSLKELAKHLNDKGYKSKRGYKFYSDTVHNILTNRFYIGTVFYKGKEKQGTHKPIISRELFGRVLAKLSRQNKHNKNTLGRKNK